MRLNYHPEADSLYINLAERPSAESREISEGVVLDYDADGKLVGIDIDNASNKAGDEFLTVIEALETLGDEDLWHLAREVMSVEARQKLEELHLKQRDEGLSPEEDAAQAKLLLEYERKMLIRAQAAKLLKDRGHDISPLLVTR